MRESFYPAYFLNRDREDGSRYGSGPFSFLDALLFVSSGFQVVRIGLWILPTSVELEGPNYGERKSLYKKAVGPMRCICFAIPSAVHRCLPYSIRVPASWTLLFFWR